MLAIWFLSNLSLMQLWRSENIPLYKAVILLFPSDNSSSWLSPANAWGEISDILLLYRINCLQPEKTFCQSPATKSNEAASNSFFHFVYICFMKHLRVRDTNMLLYSVVMLLSAISRSVNWPIPLKLPSSTTEMLFFHNNNSLQFCRSENRFFWSLVSLFVDRSSLSNVFSPLKASISSFSMGLSSRFSSTHDFRWMKVLFLISVKLLVYSQMVSTLLNPMKASAFSSLRQLVDKLNLSQTGKQN